MTKVTEPKVIPFTKAFTRDDDMVYNFQYVASEHKDNWDVRIIIDELNDDLIVKKSCTCPSFLKFNQGKDCKHIKRSIKYLKEFDIPMREE